MAISADRRAEQRGGVIHGCEVFGIMPEVYYRAGFALFGSRSCGNALALLSRQPYKLTFEILLGPEQMPVPAYDNSCCLDVSVCSNSNSSSRKTGLRRV